MNPILRLTKDALETRDRETLLEAFVAAAHYGAAKPDERDGLIDMPLPFYAAERLGFDADSLVDEAAAQLTDDEETFLRTFAGRPDRTNIASMGWQEL